LKPETGNSELEIRKCKLETDHLSTAYCPLLTLCLASGLWLLPCKTTSNSRWMINSAWTRPKNHS